MSYGYELKMSALHILTLYNAVANNGEMVKPYLVDRIQTGEHLLASKEVVVIKPSICSTNTINILRDLLVGVVENGTAKNIYSEKYSCAGKTGTAKIAAQGSYGSEYRASFAGYFPADKPKYSCIVVVTKPKKELGFYGNIVAAPVFREIRDLLFAEKPVVVPDMDGSSASEYVGLAHEINAIHKVLEYTTNNQMASNSLIRSNKSDFESVLVESNLMPDLSGMTPMDALFVLENLGLRVELKGKGKVKEQSLSVGKSIQKNQLVILRLS